MPSTERQERLFADVVRLRDVQRRLPDDQDLAAVLAGMEVDLGPAVSRNLAAKLLGISHTGLQRWIDTGDVPVVVDARGRVSVPVPALLRLHDGLREQRETGGRRLHVLEPLAVAARARADDVAAMDLEAPEWADGGHPRATRRALALHQVLARRLRRSDVVEARTQLARWRAEDRIDPVYADAWERLLALPLSNLRRALVDTGDEADDLRQNSPLAGLLSEPERRAVLARVR